LQHPNRVNQAIKIHSPAVAQRTLTLVEEGRGDGTILVPKRSFHANEMAFPVGDRRLAGALLGLVAQGQEEAEGTEHVAAMLFNVPPNFVEAPKIGSDLSNILQLSNIAIERHNTHDLLDNLYKFSGAAANISIRFPPC
jgi:hypothetical protein